MKVIYLDYAATRPLLPAVKERMIELMEKSSLGLIGNASALHDIGRTSLDILEDARAEVAEFIGAQPNEIIFTSGGSEANNTVMNIFRGKEIAVSAVEHPSVLEPAEKYAGKLTKIPVDDWGFLKSAEIPESAELVSVMLANNELGTILAPEGVKAKHLHVDATQAAGKVPINVDKLGVDYLTISAHKLGGPVGIGALYVRGGAPFTPLILGGHQEKRRRAGTSNVVLAAGFAEAIKYAKTEDYTKVADLRDYLRERILKEIPYSSTNTPEENILPNVLNMSFEAAEGESIQLYLAAEGIMVSTGSACASGDAKPSHVLMATRDDAEVAHSSIRFSLSPTTTRVELDRVMEVLPGIVERLQQISTVKIKERE